MYYEERIDELTKEINKLENICDICIDLLRFAGSKDREDYRKYSLRRSLREVINNRNYNKIRAIERELKKATNIVVNELDVEQKIENRIIDDKEVEELERVFETVSGLEDVKKLLVESLYEIQTQQGLLKSYESTIEKEEKRKEAEEYELHAEQDQLSKEKVDYKSIKEIRKRYNWPTDEEKDEIFAGIREQYTLQRGTSHVFENQENIERIVDIYDAEQLLNRKENVEPYKLAKAFEEMLIIAVEEAMAGEYYPIDGKTNMTKLIEDFGGTNFVERYAEMYEKYFKYIESLSPEKCIAFEKEFFENLPVDLKLGESLIDSEAFRKKVNTMITERLSKDAVNITESRLSNIEYNTKYMNAEEISNIYKKVSKDHRYGASTFPEVKNVCVELILQRMPGYSIDPDIIDERKAAILNDYFLESVADVKEGYAEKLVSQKELVDSKKKEYYRMSKVKQFFATANFERLKELSKKNELTAQEEKELRRMF